MGYSIINFIWEIKLRQIEKQILKALKKEGMLAYG